jgi:hypothetical protein
MLGNAAALGDVVEGLERAAGDERVSVLVARLGAAPMGMATAQELRDAVTAFRASGKKAIATPRRSASSDPATPPTTSPPPSTRSTSSPRAT